MSKNKDNKIRIGVLGTANIAKKSIIPALQELPDNFELIGVGSRSGEQNSISEISEYKLVAGYEKMLDEEALDAIYIPLPNSLHYEWVKKSLKKGLHVLVEKSMACTFDEVAELNRLAKDKQLALVENFQFRFHPQLRYILNVIKEGALGEIRVIRSNFCFPPFSDVNNIRYKAELGGGALLDAGAYPIKLSQILLGNELSVTSGVLNKSTHFGVDIWGGACIEQKKGGAFAQIAFGFDNYYQCNVEIIGSKGKLYTNRIFTAGEAVTPKIILETNSRGVEEIELKPDNHFKKMLLYFYDLILGSRDKDSEYSDNINQSRLLEEIKTMSNER